MFCVFLKKQTKEKNSTAYFSFEGDLGLGNK